MNKIIKKIILFLGIVFFAFGCNDELQEITEMNTSRLFSPIELTARVINRTQAVIDWTANTKADSYILEVFENDSLSFVGTPVYTFSEITNSDIPYTIASGLFGNTQYSVRVKAVGADIEDSKWSGVYFKTASEQLIESVTDIQAFQATIHWKAGETVTEIVLTPGDIVHTLTAGEIAAGSATVTGLASQTTYTAKLMNGTMQRGSIEFTTLIDLAGATPVNPGDDLEAIINAANDGDKFALFPGTYGTSTRFNVKKSIEIVGVYPDDKPVISGYFGLDDGVSFLLKDVILDGTGNESNQAFIFATAGQTYNSFVVEGCEIKNHDKGFYYLNVASLVNVITINNCIISDIVCNGGDFLDSRTGAIGALTISNSTVYNSCSDRDFVRYDNSAAAFPVVSSAINISNCTLYGVSNISSRRLLYVRFADHTITFANNLVVGTEGIFTNQSATAVPTFNNNNYFNAPNLLPGGATANFYDENGSSYDPQFQDVGNGNFTVNNYNVTGGDPRWQP